MQGDVEVDGVDFFRALAGVLPGVVYQARFSPDGQARVEYMSDAARWLLEIEPEAVRRDVQVFRRLIHPEDRERFQQRVEERLKSSGVWQLQYRVVLPSGSVRWISSQASVQVLADGGSVWRGFMTDVSAQVEAAAEVQRSARMLARTQRVARMGTWTVEFCAPDVSTESGDRFWWSDETFRLFGFEPGARVPSSALFYSLVHPADRERVRAVAGSAIADAEDYDVEFRAMRPDGTVRYFREAVEIVFDDLGRATGLAGTLLDITDRKNAAHELEAERERLALATSAAGIGTWDCDLRTGAIHWNDVMYEIHGVRRGEYEPNPERNYQFVAPEDRERVREEFLRCLASSAEDYAIDVQIVLPSGERRLTRSQAVILRDPSGEPVRVVGIEKDITEEKRVESAMARARESAEAAARAKSEFLATMSHEIRTPMNGVLGYTELLQATPLTAEQREYLDTIETSGQHLLAIINDVLDLSRIEAGGMRIVPAPFDAARCVRGVFEMLRPVAAGKGLQYRCTIDPALPRGMESDRGRIAQILTNILGNAIKFTDSGEVRLTAAAVPEPASPLWVWSFCVTDSGPGIPEQELARIFEPFYQVGGFSERRAGGTGLGLAISRRLAEMLGGALEVRNLEPHGCEFLLTVRAPVGADLAGSQGHGGPAVPPGNLRVLVVEDNPVNQRLCGLQLQRLGCRAEFAGDGLEAVGAMRDGRFDIVLMDMQLPALDGCAATREIRRIESERGDGRRTPIIATTANAQPEDRLRCLDAGMDDFLTKPLGKDALAAALARWSPATRESGCR
jgi:PAS domain S-box-containing protein